MKMLHGTFTCESCGTEFKRHYYPEQTLPRCCSHACWGLMIRGENHPNFKHGHITTQGYRSIYVDGKEHLEHRLVMEQHLGRKLTKNEHVHHGPKGKLCNDLDNLTLVTPGEHRRIHMTGRWSRKHDRCVICGTTQRPHEGHGLCRHCHRAKRTRDANN